jgi:sugar phosphate isomerase/epimerase
MVETPNAPRTSIEAREIGSSDMYTRREFNKLALAAIPLAATPWPTLAAPKFSSKFGGVQIGVETYSYRSLRDTSKPWSPEWVDDLLHRVASTIAEDGIDVCEFWNGLIEPPGGLERGPVTPERLEHRDGLRKWRLSRPVGIYQRARKTFNDAGINVEFFMYNFDDYMSDDETDWAFEVANILGSKGMTANCTVKSIKNAAPFAEKHKMILSAHSENAPFDPNIDGMVFGDNLVAAANLNPYMRITLDIGHFTAYNGEALKFVRENHAKISNLHLKDRLKNHPEFHTDENTPEWGKGNAPITQILQLMKRETYPFPACIEYEYKSDKPAVVEVKKCLDYAKAALA